MAHITESDFRRLDLNLLLVFNALMAERSVTRAAARLFLGQPALSGALKRLRAAFGDELFVRTSHGMTPTPRALDLSRTIEPLLLGLQHELQARSGFDPARAARDFHIGTSDALEASLMPEVMQRVHAAAPGVRVVSHPTDGRHAAQMLDAGEIELALGVFLDVPAWHSQLALFDWHFVCVYDAARVKPRGRHVAMRDYLAHPHLLTTFNTDLAGFVDEVLARQGLQRRVVYSSRNFATSAFILRQMAALTTVPTFAAHAWREAFGMAVSPLPFETPSYQVSLTWSRANEGDHGRQWLASLFAEAFTGRRFD